MSLLFQGFVQFFVWIFLRYFDVLINICEVSDLFHIVFEISVKNQNFSLTLLCLQTPNLCSGLRVIHSPQFIKKEFGNLCILPRKRHSAVSEPRTSRFMVGHSTDVLSEPLTKNSLLLEFIYTYIDT